MSAPAASGQKSGSEALLCQIPAGALALALSCAECPLNVSARRRKKHFSFPTPATEFKHYNYFPSNTRCYTHYTQFWRLSYHRSLQYVSVCIISKWNKNIPHFFHRAEDELAWKWSVSETAHVFLSTEMVKMNNKAFSPH